MNFKSLHILSLFTFLWVSAFSFAQTNEERKKSADKNFENENYVAATTDYLHLLSLDPMSHELNFKYGACLLYNSKNKGKAIRYLNYAVQDENADPRAHYFRGRALHLNFQFEEAKQNYKNYKAKLGGKTDGRYKVDRAIEMCENGKRLLTTFTDIIVAEKKEIDQSKFFRIYSDSKTIGGEILVTENFQSKLDKKMGHIPIVHFPPQAKAIYYSSYGEDMSTGLDIYIRRRLPSGGWGEPQKLPGAVNTSEDEDFPYMHPSGQFLYFSSTGHNSMGGYDIFMSRFDPNINAFQTPENVDFAISSPDDDLFYVVDSLFQNAYFASARQSEDGNLHVYRVKVARVPIQEIIVMGDFLSEINPDNKSMNIEFAAHSNGNDVGKITSNSKGKYSFVFPQGGKYDYLVEVEGSETQYKFTVELPFLSEFRPLKQKIIHTTEEGEEIVKIINLFDEDVEGAEALIAGIIRKKSELEINIDQFDLEAIETEAKEKEILASLGFDNMTLNEVKGQLAELKEANDENQEVAERIEANLNAEILAKIERIKTLDALEKELVEKAIATNDPLTKHKLLNEAHQKEIEKEELINSVEALLAINEDIKGKIGLPDSQVNELSKMVEEFVAAVEAGDDVAAIQLLDKNGDLIQAAKNGSPNQLVNNIVDESQEIEASVKKYQNQNNEYAKSVVQLNRDINALESKLLEAKKKEAEKIKPELDGKKEELRIIKEEINRNDKEIVASNKKISGLNDQIDGLQNAFDTETVAEVDGQEVAMSVKEAGEIAAKTGIDYPAEIAKVENENPELFGLASVDPVADIKKEKSNKEKAISEDLGLSELERAYQVKEINENAINESSSELAAIEKAIVDNPEDNKLQEEKAAVEEFIASLERENEELDNQVAELKAETPDAALSKEDVVAEIAPSYKEDIAALESNESIDEKKRLDEIKSKQSQFLEEVISEIEKVEDDLKADPNNAEASARKEILEEVRGSTENDIASTESKIVAISTEVVVPETITAEDVNPRIKDKMNRIEEDNSLSVTEKQEQLKEQEEDLVASVEKEQAKVDKKLSKDPDNTDLKARKDGLKQLKEVTQASIDERVQTLAALETNDPGTSNPVTEEAILASIDPEYQDKQKDLQQEAKKSKKGVVSLLELETEMYDKFQELKQQLTSDAELNPEDETKQAELDRVEEMIQNQKATIDDLQNQLVDKIDDEERKQLIAQVDPTYNSEISNANSHEVIDREVELQMAISEKIDGLEKDQNRKFSISVGLVEKQYKQLLKESQNREASARNAEPIAETSSKEEFIDELRTEAADAINKEYTNASDLEQQERSLASYEDKLTKEISEIEEGLENGPDEKLEEKKEWLEEELSAVQTKRRKVKIQIGQLESNTLALSNEDIETDEQLQVLRDEQNDLEEKLVADDLSSKEKKQLELELENNILAQTKRENEIVASKIEVEEQVTADLNEKLMGIDPESNSGITVEKTKGSIAKEEEVIAEIEARADKAKTEEERNYLLKQAESKREALNDETQEVIEELKIADLEASENVSLQTKEDLKKKKRSFTIRMGELTNEIIQKEKEIEEAKKKDKPALEKEKESLEEQRELVKNRLASVDEQLTKFEAKEPVVNPLSIKEEISFNEERQLAGTEEYEKYEVLASEALEVENQISNLEEELKLEKKAVAMLIADEKGDENKEGIQAHVQKIKTIESDIDRLGVDLIQKKWTAGQALPSNDVEAMKMQNLVARGIKPIKTTVVAAALLQMPTTGFALTKDAPSVYTAENPIPVGVESPTGLVYRVQVGAFAKPIPQDLFKEFNPVSGEKINGTNITRYMAGFFNSSDDVVNARGQIRNLGYNDAFVVAYCDGKRISFGDARRREAEGTCVPKGTNELMVEVAEKTAEKLGLPLTREVQNVPENSYNKAPGAADAEPIEEMLGLFFTVQIGVFNRPVGKKHLNNMEEVITIRLPNGQIRYSSGKFDSVEEALSRRSLALSNGVKGAFVTAYYKGERIPLSKARGLLAENGASILQSTIEREAEAEPETPDVPDVLRTDTVTNTNIAPYDVNGVNQLRVQVVTKQSFTEYPRDVLNRYNSEGSFYYDEDDGRVKSVIYKNEDYLPRLYNFRDDIDTVYIPVGMMDDELGKIVEVVFTDSIIPGDFMDMLLRFNYRRDINTIEEGVSVKVYGIQEDKLDFILNELRDFGVEPIVREESELELELEENE